METAISTQLPNQYNDGTGKIPVLGYIMFGATLAALLYQIYQSHITIKAMTVKDKKISELEHNLKTVLGSKYQTL